MDFFLCTLQYKHMVRMKMRTELGSKKYHVIEANVIEETTFNVIISSTTHAHEH